MLLYSARYSDRNASRGSRLLQELSVGAGSKDPARQPSFFPQSPLRSGPWRSGNIQKIGDRLHIRGATLMLVRILYELQENSARIPTRKSPAGRVPRPTCRQVGWLSWPPPRPWGTLRWASGLSKELIPTIDSSPPDQRTEEHRWDQSEWTAGTE